MNYKYLLIFPLVASLLSISCKERQTAPEADTRPNILWITIEDWSPDLSCYGTKGIHTPNVDQLAAEGVRYENAFTTAPVCSASRSAMMTGYHQNYINAHQHRTKDKHPLPYGIKPIPKLMEEAGYYTTLMSHKVDVNFLPDTREELFMDTKDWTGRQPGQPFFARITFAGTHRAWKRDSIRPIPTKDVEIPPYYADTEFIRRDWANGLEQMQLVDREVGEILDRLKEENLEDNTVVFFIADHGRCHIRGKQFLYDGGIHVPLIVKYPGHTTPGGVNSELVSAIDVPATVLDIAGVELGQPLHGRSLFEKDGEPRKYIFAARDKMDETHDAMRAIRSKEYKLIQNLMPERPYLQYNWYKEQSYPALAEMNVLYLKGQLNKAQSAFFAPTKPEIELYDLKNDPYELNNLSEDPDYAEIKDQLLQELEAWRTHVIKDQGVSKEFAAVDVFPEKNPMATVDQWVEENEANYDFEVNGWPSWYPTRTLEEWEIARKKWEPYVFREPTSSLPRPKINVPKAKK
ncbi:sulfatase family protein [Pseudozobellia thermophila]|uniref:Arylsulfatase A n=1 Tax=Pseudozobellia thermophila TaxID=192903 RepID=A0A1M6GGY2_9FLAO|nr:sulfatase [Pseudozobellia thermophila]SHJ09189.1 Arylsulfatase A [Pseudozobellia thermophila]